VLSTAPVWESTDAEVTATIEINTLGVVHGCRAAVDVMRRGDILNVVSLSGLGPTPGLAVYGASKAAALSYSQALHIELGAARRPIRVRALCPDAVSTELLHAVSDRPSSALLFTGPRVLGVDEVVEGALDLLSSRRQLKVLPAWRGWLTRTQSVLPAAARYLTPVVARVGERRRPVR
jgi:short-subunit dehydrogenase